MSDIKVEQLFSFLGKFGSSIDAAIKAIDKDFGDGNGVLLKREFRDAVNENWNGEKSDIDDIVDRWWKEMDANTKKGKDVRDEKGKVWENYNALDQTEVDAVAKKNTVDLAIYNENFKAIEKYAKEQLKSDAYKKFAGQESWIINHMSNENDISSKKLDEEAIAKLFKAAIDELDDHLDDVAIEWKETAENAKSWQFLEGDTQLKTFNVKAYAHNDYLKTEPEVTYTISGSSCATIDSSGLVSINPTGLKEGDKIEFTISASCGTDGEPGHKVIETPLTFTYTVNGSSNDSKIDTDVTTPTPSSGNEINVTNPLGRGRTNSGWYNHIGHKTKTSQSTEHREEFRNDARRVINDLLSKIESNLKKNPNIDSSALSQAIEKTQLYYYTIIANLTDQSNGGQDDNSKNFTYYLDTSNGTIAYGHYASPHSRDEIINEAAKVESGIYLLEWDCILDNKFSFAVDNEAVWNKFCEYYKEVSGDTITSNSSSGSSSTGTTQTSTYTQTSGIISNNELDRYIASKGGRLHLEGPKQEVRFELQEELMTISNMSSKGSDIKGILLNFVDHVMETKAPGDSPCILDISYQELINELNNYIKTTPLR